MGYKELFDFFNRIEREYPVQQWTVNGVHVWPLIRCDMAAMYDAKMLGEVYSKELDYTQNNKWKRCKRAVQKLFYELELYIMDYQHQQSWLPCDVVMFGHMANRNLKMPSGEWFDSILDPIYDSLVGHGYNIFRFEQIGEGGVKYRRWSKSFPVVHMMLEARIKSMISKDMEQNIQIDKAAYEKIMKMFIQLSVRPEIIRLKRILDEILCMEFLAHIYQAKLRKIGPQLVLTTCWYNIEMMAISFAAHELGIPVVEVQHGAAGGSNSHWAYYDWLKIPSNGYEVMPDYMWSWGQEDYEAVAKWGDNKIIPFVGGVPMDLIYSDPKGRVLQAYYDNFEKKFGKNRRVILFTLQCGVNYPNWITEFINSLDEYIWLVRLHPVVDNDQRNFLKRLECKNNIIWKTVESFPLKILLQKSSLHITGWSSVVLEGEMVGCPSIVLHPIGKELYGSQIQRGIARYAENQEELSLNVQEILSESNGHKRDDACVQEKYQDWGHAGIQRLIEIMETRRLSRELRMEDIVGAGMKSC